MADRKNKFLIKRSNVAGKIPTAGDLLLGEMALNTADAILYTSGTTAGSILPIGWDRVNITGDTMTGTLYAPSVSATTISATTFYGDGSNLTGISTQDNYTTGGTVDGNTVFFDRTDGLSAYTVDLSGLDNLPTDLEFQLFGNQSSTGLIEYGGLSANTSDNTKFDIGPMKGWIVDNTTDPSAPVVQYIDYSGATGITLTYLATNPVTYIGLSGDTTADIVQSPTPFEPDNHRDFLELGVVIHSDNVIVNVSNNLPAMGIDPTGQLYDLMHGLGYFNIDLSGDQGNVYSANGSNLNISKTGGNIFAHGSNYTNDPKNPHIKLLSSATTITFRYRISDSTEWANTTEINPNLYESGGTTAATPSNKFTVQRIAVFPSGISRLQYGQNVYDSLDDGEASLSTEAFIVENNIKGNGLLRGFIVVKEGATDLSDTSKARFISANHFGHANDTVVGNVHRTEIINHGSTGLRDGGLITADSATTFKVASGSGLIINNATDPNNPILTEVVWDDITGQTITSLTGDVATIIMIDSTENVVQFPLLSPPSQGDKRDKILLGVVAHSDNATITNLYNGPIHIISPVNQHEDLTSAIGTFSINGNFITSITGTLELEKTAGSSFYYGGNYQTDKTNPSVLNTVLLSGSSTPANPLVYASGSEVLGISGYSIDTANYDPSGAGSITALGVNKFTAHRIWHLPINNLLVFQYGQVEYNSLSLAIDGFGSENFIEPPGLNLGAYLISVVIVKEGNTDLSDITEAKFIQQGKFAGVGGGGGTIADTLQSAYVNSTQPEIITDSTRGAVDYRVGSGSDSDNLITFQSSGGTINAWVNGLGDSSFNSVSATTITADDFFGDGSNLTNITATWDGQEVITVGETVLAGDLLYLGSGSTYLKSSNITEVRSSTELRIAISGITSGSTGQGLIQGQLTTTGLTSGDKYWLGASGNFTNIQPTGDGDIVRYVGTALDSTTLEFMPDETWIELSSTSGPSTQPLLRNVTTSESILSTDFTINVTTTGDTTQTLPTAVGIIGKLINVKNSDSTGTSTITMNTTSSQTMDGNASGTLTISFPNSLTFQSDGSNWILI